MGTRATFWSHVCNGPATNAEVGRGVGCSRKFVSEISSPSRVGPPGPLDVSWNRGLVTLKGFSRAPVQNRERWIAKEAHVRCRGHNWSRLSARFVVERLYTQESRTPTVAKEFQIGLCGVVEADLELCCDSWSAGISLAFRTGCSQSVVMHTYT